MIVDSSITYDEYLTFSDDNTEEILIDSARQLLNFNSANKNEKKNNINTNLTTKNYRLKSIKKIAFSIFSLMYMCGLFLCGSQIARKIQTMSELKVLEGSFVVLTSAMTWTGRRFLLRENRSSDLVDTFATFFIGILSLIQDPSKSLLLVTGKIAAMALTSNVLRYVSFKKLDYDRARHLNDFVILSILTIGSFAFVSFDPFRKTHKYTVINSILSGLVGLTLTSLCLKAFDCLTRDVLNLSMPKLTLRTRFETKDS